MTTDVVVCGAGVGGLASAYALGALGLRVLVVDRQAGPADVPKGEILQPESVRVLDAFGALPAVHAGGAVPVARLAIRDPAGRALLNLDYADLAGDYRQILCTGYPNVLDALAGVLGPSVEVRRGLTVTGLLRDDAGRIGGIRAVRDGRPHDIPARLVVAADGLSSRLRADAGLTARREAYDHRLVAFDLAGVRVDDEVTAYAGDRGLRLVYPLPDGRCRLYVQVQPDELRGGGDLTGWSTDVLTGTPALAPLADALRAALRTRQILAVHRLRAPKLSTPGLALVGEAAHAVHPMAAQGMNSSLVDAETLAQRVAAGGGTEPAALDRALREYHAARLPRLDHTATVSHNASRMLTTTTGLPRVLGRRMMRHTSANRRLLRITTGNLAGVGVQRLTTLDRLHQFGLLPDPNAGDRPREPATEGEPR
ncbi:FAD-dependent oxidoreductase [Polymorphospora rubra]|uniref:2-octaprenyl-3-methyl-6-methoxy-1,4-benzoquinol hydroxylase n=1 Tax=Polymorphospora rubra TaxID=338584 RepID=A0A810N7Z5_9ACTN|nr:NAD(P)/FAD-dependent oxidoreductase [Polymorphospora rubra]BCJ69377.1 2-octaprenyl-3-methyl-6-methoxy-1,4-benzoquinol hydroxylase [Polymorphospora rubra]